MLERGFFINNRYEILSRVGAGGMSDVYKAKDHVLGRFVAIKVLKQEFSEDVNFVTKFRTEAQSAAGLEHPNIRHSACAYFSNNFITFCDKRHALYCHGVCGWNHIKDIY